MRPEKITIPEDLLRLKHSSDLESVPISSLARKGTSILQRIMSSAQAVAVKIQGQGAMVTVSQSQYDEMVDLIQRLRQDDSEDELTQALGQRFDVLVAGMNQAGAEDSINSALFTDPLALNGAYRPGVTETDD